MTREQITEKLKELFEMVFDDVDKLIGCTEDTRLVEDLGLDSVGILYVVVGIEEFFSVRFDDVGFSDFKTIKDVIDYLEKKVS